MHASYLVILLWTWSKIIHSIENLWEKKTPKTPKILLDIPCLGYQLNTGFIMCSAIQVSTNIGAGYDLCLSELCISAKILNKQNKTNITHPQCISPYLLFLTAREISFCITFCRNCCTLWLVGSFACSKSPFCKSKCNLVWNHRGLACVESDSIS